MRQLTKQQKIKVIDEMILKLRKSTNYFLLCPIYRQVCRSLKYKIEKPVIFWTPRFRELNQAIESELKRTGDGIIIHYDNLTDDRIDLLKKVKKQIE